MKEYSLKLFSKKYIITSEKDSYWFGAYSAYDYKFSFLGFHIYWDMLGD